MRLLVVKRDNNAEAQVVGEFLWEDGAIVTLEYAVVGAHEIMEGIRPEISTASRKACQASMRKVARRHSGGYLWARYEP